jgi:GNAT superfamily N-acetyltransferase
MKAVEDDHTANRPDRGTRPRLTIAVATIEDIPALSSLLDLLFTQEAEFKPDAAAQERGLKAIIDDGRVGTILVARDEHGIQGMVNILFTVSTALGSPVALLEDMVIAPRARGSGAGSLLLEAAVAHARERGCGRITLLTDADNHGAQRFYARHGFARSPMVPLRLSLS